jgi:hypothetical protein
VALTEVLEHLYYERRSATTASPKIADAGVDNVDFIALQIFEEGKGALA